MKKILVSQCLYGDKPVRYDGKTKEERDPRFIRWKEENRLIPVCPEVDGGLPVPRTDAQRIGDQVITRDGRDVTKEYRRGAEIALERALQEEVLCAVLKEKSPSCGSNKVYVLAKSLQMNFLDTDLLIQEAAGKSLQEIINEDGMEAFKALEEQVLCGVSASHTVIATGGSAVYYPKAMEHLKKLGRIVYIQVSVETILQRLNNITTRGVAMSKDQGIRELYEERKPLYESYAEVTVGSGSGSMEDTVADIIDKVLRLRQSFR